MLKPIVFKEQFKNRSPEPAQQQTSLTEYKIDYNNYLGSGRWKHVYAVVKRPDSEKGWLAYFFPLIYDYFFRPEDDAEVTEYCVKIFKSCAELIIYDESVLILRTLIDSFYERSQHIEAQRILRKYRLSKIDTPNTPALYAQLETRINGKTLNSLLDDNEFEKPDAYEIRKAYYDLIWALEMCPLEIMDLHADNIMYDECDKVFQIVDGSVEETEAAYTDTFYLKHVSCNPLQKRLLAKVHGLASDGIPYSKATDNNVLDEIKFPVKRYSNEFYSSKEFSDIHVPRPSTPSNIKEYFELGFFRFKTDHSNSQSEKTKTSYDRQEEIADRVVRHMVPHLTSKNSYGFVIMKSVYLIIDFTYNPKQKDALKVLELGDAFVSSYPSQTLGNENISMREKLINDLKKRFPDALFVEVYPAGLTLHDLSNDYGMITYDKTQLFDNSLNTIAPSRYKIVSLVENIASTAVKRSKRSKPLVFWLGFPRIASDISISETGSDNITYLHSERNGLTNSFYDKETYHTHAQANPLYPTTLLIDYELYNQDFDINGAIKVFLNVNQSDYYIIKPTQGTRSCGVHVVARSDVKDVVNKIIDRQYPDMTGYNDPFHRRALLIQVCHFSKEIKHKGRMYYSKGRALIRADFSEGDDTPTLDILSGYLRLAGKPCGGKIDDKSVITNNMVNPSGVLSIDPHDWQCIHKLIHKHLPSILCKLQSDKDNGWINQKFECKNAPHLSRENEYVNNLKAFFEQQILVPMIPTVYQRLYIGFNRYIDNSNSDMNTKNLIIDLVGMDQSYKKITEYNNDSTNTFITNAVGTLFQSEVNQLQKTVPQHCVWAKEAKHTGYILTIAVLVNMMINRDVSPSSIRLVLLTSILTLLLVRGTIFSARSFFGTQKSNDSNHNFNMTMPSTFSAKSLSASTNSHSNL